MVARNFKIGMSLRNEVIGLFRLVDLKTTSVSDMSLSTSSCDLKKICLKGTLKPVASMFASLLMHTEEIWIF